MESGHAYAAGGDVYFRVASFDGYGKLSNRPLEEMQQGEGDDAADAQGEPAGLRALEGAQGGRGHLVGGALGRGPAGLAHRVLGDGRADPRRATSRSTAAAPTSSSRTTRTRSPRPRPRAASRWPGSGCTTAWSSSSGEKMAKSVGNIRLLHGALDEYGPRRAGHVLRRRPLPPAARVLARRRSRTPRGAVGARRDFVPPARPARGASRRASRVRGALLRRAGRRLQHRRGPRAALFDWVARGQPAHRRGRAARRGPAGARCCTRSGLEGAARGRRRGAPARRPSGCCASARRRAPRATSSRPTASATSWPSSASRCATRRTARSSSARGA